VLGVYRAGMEVHFTSWAFPMFAFNAVIAILGFSLIHREMRRQAARQGAIWQRLFTEADNTERVTREILTRLAGERAPR
jgi:hypothetical protein